MNRSTLRNECLIVQSRGDALLACLQLVLLLLSVLMLLQSQPASAAITGYVFTDADAGGPSSSIRPIGTDDVIYRYDVATDSVVVELRPADFLTPTNRRDTIQLSAVHAGPRSDFIYFAIETDATFSDGTLVTAGDVLIYDRIAGSVDFHAGIRALELSAKGIDGLYVFEEGPEAGKVLLSLSSNGNFTYPNPGTVKPYDACGNRGDGATCSFNSRGQDVIEYDPALRHPTIRFNAGTGILVDAVHITDSGEIAISCEARKCNIGGVTFDENDIIELTLDANNEAISGVALRPDIGSLYSDPGVNIDGFSIYGTFAPELDHFSIVKDPAESPSACSPATITISAIDTDGNVITDYAGTINLSTSTGQGDWALAAGNVAVVGTGPTDARIKAGAGDGTASYSFNGAANGDGGTVTLQLSHPEARFVDINVSDGGNPAVTELSGNGTGATDQHPAFGPCANSSGADHFSIAHRGEGINCTPSSITIRAVDASGVTLTDYAGDIRLSTSTGHGDWSIRADGGAGTLVAGAADSGNAQYTFAAADQGVVTLQLAYTHQGTISINVTDGSATETSNAATLADDPDLTFVPAGLRFCEWRDGVCNPISTQISGKPSGAAPNRGPLYVQAIGTAADGSCEALCAGSVDVQMTYDCVDPSTCAAPALAVNNTRITERSLVVGGDFTRVALDFGTGSDHAPFSMNYQDAGKVRLYAKIPASASTPASCETTVARSNDLVVRPFTLGISDVKSGTTANPEGTASTGSGFVSAGTPFEYTVSALRWQAADDANNDGHADAGADLTDNRVTPNFKAFTQPVSLEVASVTPTVASGGSPGTLGGPQSIAGAGFTNGSATVANQTYSEVGSVRLAAGLNDYLGTRGADIRGLSPVIGRFYPDRISVMGSVDTTACGFAYMDQPAIDTLFTLRAENTAGDVTENYDASRGYLFTDSVEAVLEDSDDGTNRFARTDIDVVSGLTWNAGLANHGGFAQTFSRITAPDGPFTDLQMGLILNSTDNVPLVSLLDGSGVDMNADTTGACGAACNAKKLGSPIQVLYGRATIRGATGSPSSDLAAPAAAEYFDGTSFVTNSLDQCSAWTESQLDLRFEDDDTNPNDSTDPAQGVTTINVDAGNSTASIGNPTLVDGSPGISLSAPGAGNTGTVFVKLDVSAQPWLLFDWGTADGNPPEAGMLFYGGRRGDDQIIYWRERFR